MSTTAAVSAAPHRFTVAESLVLIATNIAAVAVYVLWHLADTWAVNRAELTGFDPTMMLPHSLLFWLAAHGLLVCVLALDVVTLRRWLRSRRH